MGSSEPSEAGVLLWYHGAVGGKMKLGSLLRELKTAASGEPIEQKPKPEDFKPWWVHKQEALDTSTVFDTVTLGELEAEHAAIVEGVVRCNGPDEQLVEMTKGMFDEDTMKASIAMARAYGASGTLSPLQHPLCCYFGKPDQAKNPPSAVFKKILRAVTQHEDGEKPFCSKQNTLDLTIAALKNAPPANFAVGPQDKYFLDALTTGLLGQTSWAPALCTAVYEGRARSSGSVEGAYKRYLSSADLMASQENFKEDECGTFGDARTVGYLNYGTAAFAMAEHAVKYHLKKKDKAPRHFQKKWEKWCDEAHSQAINLKASPGPVYRSQGYFTNAAVVAEGKMLLNVDYVFATGYVFTLAADYVFLDYDLGLVASDFLWVSWWRSW